MKSFCELPGGYTEYFSLDLQKDKKKMLLVNALAVLIAIVMAVPMHFCIPVSTVFNAESGRITLLVKALLLLVMLFSYMFLHELVHGVAMKVCGTQKVNYGFTGIYAYAGSTDYYDKGAYILIALAPIVTFFILLSIVNLVVPLSWFWVIYIVQIVNISGAAGDIYVTCKFLRMPKDILIKDAGVSMLVYARP